MFNNLFKKNPSTTDLIKDIRSMTSKIEANTGKYKDIPTYIEGDRSVLNVLIMEALMGCQIKINKVKDLNAAFNGGKVDSAAVTFDLPLPTYAQVSEIALILREFIPKENLILAKLNASLQGVDPDTITSAPVSITLDINGQPQQRVRTIDKPSNKKIRDEIFHQDMMVSCRIDDADCYVLASIGEQARKKANRDTVLIVGGVTIVITAAAVGGIMYYNHYKKSKAEENEELTDENLSIGDDLNDIEVVDVPMEVAEISFTAVGDSAKVTLH